MERLSQPKNRGLGKNQVLFWGLLFLLAGMIGRGFLQNRVLRMGNLTGQQLLEAMSVSGAAMAAATVALVMQALETCAVPIFAFLLADGFEKAKNRKRMLLLLLITAVVSEIPYNLAMNGSFLHMGSRNPAVALLIAVAVMYFFHRYSENSFKDVLIRAFVGISSVLWAAMLHVDHGVAFLVVFMVMWGLRKKKQLRTMFGTVASTACALVSPFYLASGMGVLPVHFYREDEEAPELGFMMYLVYPILLSCVAGLSYLI